MPRSAGPRADAAAGISLDGEALAGLMRAVLAKGKPFRFEARGASMHPVIRDGDVVTVRPLGKARPAAGEVVAFVHPLTGGVLVHRIVDAVGPGFALKGDNALGGDGVVAPDAVLGRVARIERGGRAVRVGPALRSPMLARLSRTAWFTRLVRRVRRSLGRSDRKA
jgi:hypothetical protein